MSQEPLDPLTDMDAIFDLGVSTGDDIPESLRQMYEVLIVRLRREAQAMPNMTTIQLLLIERIARNYIVLRLKESLGANEGGFAHATAQKEFNSFWLSMTQEFNRQMRQIPDGEYFDELIKRVKTSFKEALEVVEDPDLRMSLQQRFRESTERAGL